MCIFVCIEYMHPHFNTTTTTSIMIVFMRNNNDITFEIFLLDLNKRNFLCLFILIHDMLNENEIISNIYL